MNFLKKMKSAYIKFLLYKSSAMKKADIYRKYYGVNIGNNVRIMGKPRFGTEPYLITIGDNVTITEGVTILTHDGGVGLFREEFDGINIMAEVKVGDNVFIGANSTILPGVSVGNNVVIGAGSVVTKDIPDDLVVAGVPAKVIKNISEYKDSCLKKAIYVFSNKQETRKREILNALGIK